MPVVLYTIGKDQVHRKSNTKNTYVFYNSEFRASALIRQTIPILFRLYKTIPIISKYTYHLEIYQITETRVAAGQRLCNNTLCDSIVTFLAEQGPY